MKHTLSKIQNILSPTYETYSIQDTKHTLTDMKNILSTTCKYTFTDTQNTL